MSVMHLASRRALGAVAAAVLTAGLSACSPEASSASEASKRLEEQRAVAESERVAAERAKHRSKKTTAPAPAKKPRPKKTVKTRPAAKRYANCADLRREYPNGITKAQHPDLYDVNGPRLDRDKDGEACETTA